MRPINIPVLLLTSLVCIVLLLVGLSSRDPDATAVGSVPLSPALGSASDRVESAQSAATGAAASRLPSQRSTSLQPTRDLLATLAMELPDAALQALHAEVDSRFAQFLAGLGGSQQRTDEVRLALVSAYADRLAFAVAQQRGDISAMEAETRADPNYVLSEMATLLDAAELTALENFMESDARQRFLTTYTPQLEVIGVELGVVERERVLEALFSETYLLSYENGIGAASDLESSLQRQLDAIGNARDTLRRALSAAQFEQADKFLIEQERGLLGAQVIFSTD